MPKVSTSSLAVIHSSEIVANKQELARLQKGIVDNLRLMQQLRGEEALRGLVVGLGLLRVKHSMPHGTFGPWVKQNVTQFGERWTNYLMRLAMTFVDKMKVAKPELLALPGDQVELALESAEGVQRQFLRKAVKFVGELSLTELLIKYGIKGVGLKTALEQGDETAPAAGTAEDYFSEVAERVYGFRQVVTSRESLMRLSTQQLETVNQAVTDTYTQFRKLYEEAKGKSAAVPV